MILDSYNRQLVELAFFDLQGRCILDNINCHQNGIIINYSKIYQSNGYVQSIPMSIDISWSDYYQVADSLDMIRFIQYRLLHSTQKTNGIINNSSVLQQQNLSDKEYIMIMECEGRKIRETQEILIFGDE